MQEFTNSTEIASDRAALRSRLAQDGYLFFRGLLDPAAVQQVRADVAASLDAAGWLTAHATSDRPLPTGAAVREGGPGYVVPYTAIQRSQRFHELAHQAALTGLLHRILDEPVLVHPRKIARTSLPRDDEYTPPHQDFRLIQGTVDALTTWVPLGDCPTSLGGLRILAGSHRHGLYPADPALGPGGMTIEVDDDDAAWRTTDYTCGDVVLFTSLTVHGALRNDEDTLRFSADFRYQASAEPVVADSLLPHYHPQVPDWDQLTAGWTGTTSVETPAGVRVVDLLGALDPRLQAAPSRLLSVA